MAQSNAPQSIKIFLASPGDVDQERNALSALVREINDVLAFLVPDRALRLELIRYETHTFPDIGRPQTVINRQIPIDYDIFVGVMWRRAGTPTDTAESGTIEEFRRALAHREQTGHPIIMFYFCDESVPFPRSDDLIQLQKVVAFREELTLKGYTLNYPNRAEFRDHVRGGILRAVADLLRGTIVVESSPTQQAASPSVPDVDQRDMAALAEQYDVTRQTMGGRDRTQKMTAIVASMRLKAASVRPLVDQYKGNSSAGFRLAAIAVLQQFPDRDQLDWLADRLDPDKERPFLGYQAGVALAQAVRSLPASDYNILTKVVTRALELAKRNPDDPPRIKVLNTALHELQKLEAGRP
jgi:hypothetical protein